MSDTTTQETIENTLDPRGLIASDLKYIRSKLPALRWIPGTTLEEISYMQGQYDLLEFIETTMVGRTR